MEFSWILCTSCSCKPHSCAYGNNQNGSMVHVCPCMCAELLLGFSVCISCTLHLFSCTLDFLLSGVFKDFKPWYLTKVYGSFFVCLCSDNFVFNVYLICTFIAVLSAWMYHLMNKSPNLIFSKTSKVHY